MIGRNNFRKKNDDQKKIREHESSPCWFWVEGVVSLILDLIVVTRRRSRRKKQQDKSLVV